MLIETNDTSQFESTIEAIHHLSEDDAKSLLKIIYGFINTAMTGNGGDPLKIEVVEKVSDLYQKIHELNDIRNNKSQ